MELMKPLYQYPLRYLSRDYYIKIVTGECPKGRLVGVSGLIQVVGQEFAIKFALRAIASKEDKCICKLRRGIKVAFYVR